MHNVALETWLSLAVVLAYAVALTVIAVFSRWDATRPHRTASPTPAQQPRSP